MNATRMHRAPPRRVSARQVAWILSSLMAIAVGGCSGDSDKVKTYPVRGQVLVDGKPAEHVSLVFIPTGGEAQAHKLTPRATTDKDGFYELKTYWAGDGAPLGEYRVTASWRGPRSPNADSEDFSVSAYEERPDLLKRRYGDPDKTPSLMTVQGAGDLPPLQLNSK